VRILVLTNLYPPHHIGGYEIGCKDVVDALKNRGHDIRVLTSKYGGGVSSPTEGIYRDFYDRWTVKTSGFHALWDPMREFSNHKIWRKHLRDFRPDMVYFWNMANIGIWPFEDTFVRGLPSACYVSDQWLERAIDFDPWLSRFGKRYSLLNRIQCGWSWIIGYPLGLHKKWPPSELPQLHYTSEFIKTGVMQVLSPPQESEVIHWGIDAVFTSVDLDKRNTPPDGLNLLYTGTIVPHKGVKTAIQGVSDFIRRNPNDRITFRLAGAGPEQFLQEMTEFINFLGMESSIHFVGRLPREELFQLCCSSQIYVFPSEWDEPFAISPLEAMGAGCAVVATATGGSGEFFKHGENALVFKTGDAADLSICLQKLRDGPDLMRSLAAAGSSDVRRDHTMSGMVDRIEQKLERLTNFANLRTTQEKSSY
jgi:glycogen synthase